MNRPFSSPFDGTSTLLRCVSSPVSSSPTPPHLEGKDVASEAGEHEGVEDVHGDVVDPVHRVGAKHDRVVDVDCVDPHHKHLRRRGPGGRGECGGGRVQERVRGGAPGVRADDDVREDVQGVVRALDAAPHDDDVRGRNQRPRDDHQHPDVEQVGGVDGRRGVDGGVGGEDAVDCDVEPGGERGDRHVRLEVEESN